MSPRLVKTAWHTGVMWHLEGTRLCVSYDRRKRGRVFTIWRTGRRQAFDLHVGYPWISGFEVSLGGLDEYDVTFTLGVPFIVTVLLRLNGVLPRHLRERLEHEYTARVTGLTLYNDMLTLRIWRSDGIYRSRGFEWTVLLRTLLFGRPIVSRTCVTKENAVLAFPEGPYIAQVTITYVSYSRQRWSVPDDHYEASVEVLEGGIPLDEHERITSWTYQGLDNVEDVATAFYHHIVRERQQRKDKEAAL